MPTDKLCRFWYHYSFDKFSRLSGTIVYYLRVKMP